MYGLIRWRKVSWKTWNGYATVHMMHIFFPSAAHPMDIKNNVTTQLEIIDWFGVPFKEGNENGYTMWTYQIDKWKVVGEVESKNLVILFDDKNKVKAYRYESSY